MNEENKQTPPPNKRNILYQFDNLVKKFIPNFNIRAILYLTFIFAIAMYLQIWRISSQTPPPTDDKQETIVADEKYWQSKEYKDKIQHQTIESFTSEFERWLNDNDHEFSRRKFEDMFFINNGLTTLTGGDLATVVPESFNYLENLAKARYQYAKNKGFLNDKPVIIKHGTLVCDIEDKTEKDTGIELSEWRYASMPKLAEFMNSNPDWKVKIGDRILDVSEPRIENKDVLKLLNSENQPVGLFSFLVFRNSQSNRIYLADSTILEKNGIDDALTMARISTHWDKQPKLYFKYGYEGCKQINNAPQVDYGQSH